jgi:hypothetical protein
MATTKKQPDQSLKIGDYVRIDTTATSDLRCLEGKITEIGIDNKVFGKPVPYVVVNIDGDNYTVWRHLCGYLEKKYVKTKAEPRSKRNNKSGGNDSDSFGCGSN